MYVVHMRDEPVKLARKVCNGINGERFVSRKELVIVFYRRVYIIGSLWRNLRFNLGHAIGVPSSVKRGFQPDSDNLAEQVFAHRALSDR